MAAAAGVTMLLLLGCFVTLGPPASASGDDSYVQVTVNGEPVAVEAALAGSGFDVSGKSYTLCQTDGSSTQLGVTGWSAEAVLKAAGVRADQVSSVSIPRVSGDGDVTLHPADYDPGAAGYRDFPEGPAVLVRRTVGANSAAQDDFFRPYRSAGCASDPNGPDYVRTPNGGVLELDIASGTQLQVSSAVDRGTVSAGQSAMFTGSVANPPPGAALTYRWHFGDGSLGSGATVSHTYASPGTYTVTLTADSGAAAGGAATPLTETVGSADGSRGPATSASAAAKPRPGGTVAARRPGTATSAARASPAPTAARPPAARPAATGSPASSASPAAPSEAPGEQAPAVGTVGPAQPVPPPVIATGSPAPSGTQSPTGAPEPAAGTLVSGRLITLLAGGRTPAAADRSASDTPNETAAALTQALGPHGTRAARPVPWAPYAVVAVLLALLGSGAVAELRSSRQNDRR